MKISISGYGEHGKDETAKILKQISTLQYTKSTSAYCKTEMFEHMKTLGFTYENEESCYNDRINHRNIWAEYIDILNKDDPAFLYKRCLKEQDILTGVRRHHEFAAVKALGVIDISIWIERKNWHKNDTTQTYGPEMCDLILLNDNLIDLRTRVINLCRSWRILKCQHDEHLVSSVLKRCDFCHRDLKEIRMKAEDYIER